MGEKAKKVGLPEISVIIPTTCESRRRDCLRRAINSVLLQEGVEVEAIVVVNGKRYCQELFQELKQNMALSVHYLPEGNVAAAQYYGRSHVSKKYFSFLDDDDEYLSGGLKLRCGVLEENNYYDVVVTNGYMFDGQDKIHMARFDQAQADPLTSLLQENWLASCGGAFRTETVSLDYFDGKTKHNEWTLLAFKLVMGKLRIGFVNVPTFRLYNTPASESKTDEFTLSGPVVLEYMLTCNLPKSAARKVKRKLAAALHDISNYYRKSGDFRHAWHYHIESMSKGGVARYLFYTRRLLRPNRGR